MKSATVGVYSGLCNQLGPDEIAIMQEHTFCDEGLMHFGLEYAAGTSESKYYMAINGINRLVGIGLAIVYEDPDREGVIWFQVFVDENHRRKGIGSKIYSCAKRDFDGMSVDGTGSDEAAKFFGSVNALNLPFPDIEP